MLEVNKPYTGKELAEALGISYGTFRNNKNNILYNISLISEFSCEVGSRGQVIQTFTEVWDEQRSVGKGTKQKEKARELVREALRDAPQQTASNLGEICAQELGVCAKTAARQCGQVLKEYYGDNGADGQCVGKVWCYHKGNKWQPLDEKDYEELFKDWGKWCYRQNLSNDAEIGLSLDEMDAVNDGRMKILSALKQSWCEKMGWRWIARVNGQFPHDS